MKVKSNQEINIILKDCQKLILNNQLEKIFLNLTKHVKEYLGNVYHICTNEYIKREGVVLWTDHGIVHTSNVLENLWKLKSLFRKCTPYEKFILFSGALTHDIGMFVRLVEGDINTQRRYHGRLAEIILGNILASGDINIKLKPIDVWYIGTLSRLHQTKEFNHFNENIKRSGSKLSNPIASDSMEPPRHYITHKKIAQLGALLLLADGLDIINKRSNHNIFKAFQSVIGQINPKSSAEWLTNSLVNSYSVKYEGSGLIRVSYYITPKKVNKELQLDIEEGDKNYDEFVSNYFLSFLWRYVFDSHFFYFRKQYKKINLRIDIKYIGVGPS